MTRSSLPPTCKIIPPKDGWKASTYYVVEVAYKSSNPIHRSILYTGFLNKDGTPGSYSAIFNGTSVHNQRYENVYYLRYISEIPNIKS